MGQIDGYNAKTALVDADQFILQETTAGLTKKTLWSSIKATLKTYFDGLYSTVAVYKTASYAILDGDGYGRIEVDTVAGAATITLPLMANNTGRRIEIAFVKNDASLDVVTISPHATDTNTISNSLMASMTLLRPGQSVILQQSDNSDCWEVVTQGIATYGGAPIYACRAWVNFNGTGTVAIRGSGNVSSITDGGTGVYTINFTANMPDVNYCSVTDFSRATTWADSGSHAYTHLVGSCIIVTIENNTPVDSAFIKLAIFR